MVGCCTCSRFTSERSLCFKMFLETDLHSLTQIFTDSYSVLMMTRFRMFVMALVNSKFKFLKCFTTSCSHMYTWVEVLYPSWRLENHSYWWCLMGSNLGSVSCPRSLGNADCRGLESNHQSSSQKTTVGRTWLSVARTAVLALLMDNFYLFLYFLNRATAHWWTLKCKYARL